MSNANEKQTVTFIRRKFSAMLKAAINEDIAAARLKQKKAGTYTLSVEAAIKCNGNEKLWDTVVGDFIDDVRNNVNGIAEKNNCDPSIKTPGKYKVPSSLSTAKSHLKRAMKFGVELVDEHGKPRAFSQIREEASKAQMQYDKEHADAETRDRLEIAETAGAIIERSKKLSGAELAALKDIINGVYKELNAVGAGDTIEADSVSSAEATPVAEAA